MKNNLVGLFVILAVFATAKCDKVCEIEGKEVKIPDAYDCAAYVEGRMASYRFPTFPWIRFPPILSTLLPLIPRWPTTPAPEDETSDKCPEEGIKQIPHPKDCEKYILCVNGMEFERSCAPGFHFSRKLQTCVTPELAECDEHERVWECPDEDDLDNLVFLPNTKDCSMYYLCLGGEKIPFTCAKGLHWSIDEEACMEKDDANCKFEDDHDDVEECPDEGIKNIAHPYDCELYILCVNGNRFERSCAPGFHFSREIRQCTTPEEANCKGGRRTCPAEDDLDNLVFLPNEEECSKYYVCWGGEPFPLSCADGNHWSVKAEACVDKREAGCEDFDAPEECPADGIKSISHPKNCGMYILCVNGMQFERNCAAGLHFSRELRQCTTPDIAECEDDDREYCPEDGIKNIAHPEECGKYVLCVNGMAFERSCAPGLHFSRELRACTNPRDAECEDSAYTCPDEDDLDNLVFLPNTEDCNAYYVCWGGEPIALTCGTGLHWSHEAQMCLPIAVAECPYWDGYEACPEEGVANVAHPTDCSMFILCVNGVRLERNCAPGLHFSRELSSCVQPGIANCQ